MIDPPLDQWLKQNGYKHYVFVSYARSPDATCAKFAQIVARALREAFADFTTNDECGRVFLDHECIPKGTKWEPILEAELCRSVLMVAICSPIYYHPEHRWCGREYQAMSSLDQIRGVSSILPILVRKFPNHPLPKVVADLTYCDLVAETTRDRRFVDRQPFRQMVGGLMQRASEVGSALRENNIVADPARLGFQFPAASAFDDYNAPVQIAPLRSR
jgi:hypothetical protein